LLALLAMGSVAASGCGDLTSTRGSSGRGVAGGERAGAATAASGNAPVAFVVPGELALHEGRLYVTAWFNNVDPQQPVQIHLRGPGAPVAPLSVRPQGSDGACIGMTLDAQREGIQGWSEACSFPFDTTGREPGAYTIQVTQGGRTLGEQPFALVNVAPPGHAVQLAVDPSLRARQAYFRPQGLTLWVPVDARFRHRVLTVAWFRDQTLVATESRTLEGPSLREGAPLLSVQPVLVRRQDTENPAGHWTVVALLDREAPAGSWEYALEPVGAHAPGVLRIDGIGPGRFRSARGEPLGHLRAVASPSEARVSAASEAAVQQSPTPPGGYPEGVVCAALRDRAVAEQLHQLEQLEAEMRQAGVEGPDAATALRTPAAPEPRGGRARNTSRRAGAATNGVGDWQARQTRLVRELQRAASAQSTGCLAESLPESLRPLVR
jgi:hypothetical protein